jgi:hypothetical protein
VRKKTLLAALASLPLILGACASTAQPAPHDAAKANGDPPFSINVTSSPYNAACNGSTDDTSAIQSALNAAPSTGARVVIPATSAGCKITSTLTVPPRTILEGETPDTLIWFNSTANGPAVQLGSTTATGSPVDMLGGGLQNIGIIGNGTSYTSQIGVQISRSVDGYLSNVFVDDTGIGIQVDGGPTGMWNGELTIISPMVQNVTTGIKFVDSGGAITDTRCCSGGYIYGTGNTSGYGIYGADLHSSQFTEYSIEHFLYGLYLDTGSHNNNFFGGRVENTGVKDDTHAYVCNGSGTNSVFWNPYDADTLTTTVRNTNGANCTQK